MWENQTRYISESCFTIYDTLVRGYTAPEYAIHGQLSEKADTYSYGIVVLEIISGQKSTDVKGDEDSREYLLQRVSDFSYVVDLLAFSYRMVDH